MAETISLLCAATSLAAAALLFRMWRTRGRRLLLWSCLCFAGLAVNDVLLSVDLVVVWCSVRTAAARPVACWTP